jgi:hypothetical protein
MFSLSNLFINSITGQTEILSWFIGTILLVIVILFIAYCKYKENR